MSDWPLLSLVIFLPLVGAGFILLIRGEVCFNPEKVLATGGQDREPCTAGGHLLCCIPVLLGVAHGQ